MERRLELALAEARREADLNLSAAASLANELAAAVAALRRIAEPACMAMCAARNDGLPCARCIAADALVPRTLDWGAK